MKEEYKSRVYTDRPPYADYDAPRKFQAIQSIVGKHLLKHPNEYRAKYNEYKKERLAAEKAKRRESSARNVIVLYGQIGIEAMRPVEGRMENYDKR